VSNAESSVATQGELVVVVGVCMSMGECARRRSVGGGKRDEQSRAKAFDDSSTYG
jgi:hypothetical protein